MEGLNAYNDNEPLPFKHFTKIKGPPERHIEQLWDEINKIKERLRKLENDKGFS